LRSALTILAFAAEPVKIQTLFSLISGHKDQLQFSGITLRDSGIETHLATKEQHGLTGSIQ
jgi:hypothetical protein